MSLSDHSLVEVSLAITGGALVYSAAVALLATIWTRLALSSAADDKGRANLVSGYLKSQFAKYLPGNVFQYAIRHALGRQAGLPHGSLAAAALLEAFLLTCAAAAVVVLFGMPMLHAVFSGFPHIPRACSALVLLIIPLLAWLPDSLRPRWLPRYHWGLLATALVGYGLFFMVFGGLFFATLTWFSPGQVRFLDALSSGSLAWLIGFLVPGAPAGAGLRETVLALGSGSMPPSHGVLTVIVVFRLVTLGGDFLAFLAGAWFGSRPSARRKVL